MSSNGKSPSELMKLDWVINPAGWDEKFTVQDLEAAAAVDSAKTLRRVETVLLRIEQQMRSLGADGLHELIRLQVRELRAAGKARRAETKAKKAAVP